MTLQTLTGLAGLALVDSTSFGTLVLPLAMLAHERVRGARVLLYLAAIGGFYWLLGLSLLAGAGAVIAWWGGVGESRTTAWVLLVVGAVMLVGSFWPDTRWARQRRERRTASGDGRQARWRDHLVGDRSRASTVITVALSAGLIEAASMLPYLGAIGLITNSGVAAPAQVATLTAYVLVMLAPAGALLAVRLVFADRLRPSLVRLGALAERYGGGALWWIVGIVGFLLVADSVQRLRLVG